MIKNRFVVAAFLIAALLGGIVGEVVTSQLFLPAHAAVSGGGCTQLRGTWIPSFTWNNVALDNVSIGGTYSQGPPPGGNWIKCGSYVWVEGDAQIATLGAGFGTIANGQLFTINGLPFTSASDAGAGYFFSFAFSALNNGGGAMTNVNYMQGGIAAGDNRVQVARLVLGVETFVRSTEFQVGTYVKFSGSYLTNQ